MLLPIEVEQVNINLEEIQSLDPHEIIKHKLFQAGEKMQGEMIVEDGSLYLEALNNKLPGPFVRWFNESLSSNWYYELAKATGKYNISAKTIIGLKKTSGEVLFFEGNIKGKIVSPRGNYKFGYDEIFLPEEEAHTLSELKDAGNFNYSSRAEAVRKLKEYILNNN